MDNFSEIPPKPEQIPPKAATPVAVIALFDRLVVKNWGAAQARPWPSPKDALIAQEWLKTGATLAEMEGVIDAVMQRMAANKQSPPQVLSYCTKPLLEAISSAKQLLKLEKKTDEKFTNWRGNPPKPTTAEHLKSVVQRYAEKAALEQFG